MSAQKAPVAPEGPGMINLAALQKEWPQWALFLGLTLAISFAQKGEALDNHWTTAWAILGLAAVGLSLAGAIKLERPLPWAIGMAVLGIQAARGGHCSWEVLAQLGWIWTWIWTVPNPKALQWWKGAKALPICALIIGCVMLMHALGDMLQGDWDHGASYDMTLPWAHRNIAMEALFLMGVLGAHFSKRRWLWWWSFITVLAMVYQVRSVLLGSALWMVYMLWTLPQSQRWIKRAFIIACTLFASVQVAWNLLPSDVRIREFAKMPDIVKALDITYNLKGAESSSIRLNLWSWTMENSQWQGAGLGAWRNDAEGHVNLTVGRCGEALHRAHSEFLQWGYEIGWLPILLLVGLCWPLRKSLGRWVWFALPFFAFTFPAERAEILWPLAMLGWALKLQFPPLTPPKFGGSELANKRLLIGSFAAILLLLGSWIVAQNAMGRIFQQSGNLRVDWSSTEEACIALHPQDIALNHADVFRVMADFNRGRSEAGKEQLDRFLADNPRSIPAIRVWLKLNGESNGPDAVCRALEARLEADDLAEAEATRPPLLAAE